jgi:hypothetical protein
MLDRVARGDVAAGEPRIRHAARPLAPPTLYLRVRRRHADVAPFWQELYAAGADVILNGHAHGYERFAPQDPNENYDPVGGLREFVLGTGGEDFHPFTTSKLLTERRDDQTFGILTLTLHPDGYDWSFAPVAGGVFSDSGSGSCH